MGNKIIPQEGSFEIVFEDENYLVVNKRRGVVVHPGVKNEQDTLANYVLGYLQEKGGYDKQLKRAGIVHRLDKGVGGLIVFAKNRRVQKHLAKQFESHEVLKIYYAEIQCNNGEFFKNFYPVDFVYKVVEAFYYKKDIDLTNWRKLEGSMRRDEKNRKKYIFLPYTFEKSLRNAKSYVLPLCKDKVFVLIETSRTYQIRATLKSLGCIVKGDRLYGAKTDNSDSIFLYSVVLGFEGLDCEKRFFNIIESFV